MTKEDIIQAQQEFEEKGTYVTIEYSIHTTKLEEFENILKEIKPSNLGQWILMKCDTCISHHGEGYLHLSLDVPEVIKEMKKATNFIKIYDNL